MGRFLHIVLALTLMLATRSGSGAFPRNVAFDLGAGVPSLVFAQANAKVTERWQLGFGYGLLGMFYRFPAQTLPTQTVTLGIAGDFTVTPVVTPGMGSLNPYVRFFPGPSNFYLQFAFNMVQATADITGTLLSVNPLVPAAAQITGKVSVTQPLPTISVGDVWTTELYFVSVNIGIGFYMSPWSSVAINGGFPPGLGDDASQAAALAQISTAVQNGVTQASNQLKTQLPFVPCISVSFGVML